MDTCNNLSVLGTLFYIKTIIAVICVIVPVLLLLMLTIDFAKAVVASDPQKINLVKKSAVKRIIFAVIVFLVPYIVNGAMGLLEDTSSFFACYDMATSANVQKLANINELERKAKLEEDEEKRQKLLSKMEQQKN